MSKLLSKFGTKEEVNLGYEDNITATVHLAATKQITKKFSRITAVTTVDVFNPNEVQLSSSGAGLHYRIANESGHVVRLKSHSNTTLGDIGSNQYAEVEGLTPNKWKMVITNMTNE